MASEQEAVALAKKWKTEYDREKQNANAEMEGDITPPPPARCEKLTAPEREDVAKAKIIALKRQWPNCFAIFEKRKADPKWRATEQEMEDAILLDSFAQGRTGAGGSIRCDLPLISALTKAAERFARRGKSKITDAAIYLIAFHWELGWCYSSDKETAGKLAEILQKPFTAGQVKQLRFRTLGLIAKHKPGPEPNLPD